MVAIMTENKYRRKKWWQISAITSREVCSQVLKPFLLETSATSLPVMDCFFFLDHLLGSIYGGNNLDIVFIHHVIYITSSKLLGFYYLLELNLLRGFLF